MKYSYDKGKSAFTCHRGLLHFNIMPFGLANVHPVFPPPFLQGEEKYTLAYLGYILVFSDSVEQNLDGFL